MKFSKELTTVTPLSKKLALLMFILMPIISFFFGMQYQEMIDLANRQQSEMLISTPKRILTPTPDPTANWKTYTDIDNQFSLKYPSDWSYKLGEPAKTLYFSKPGGDATLSISVSEALSFDTIVRKISFNGTVEDTTLDGVSGKTVKFDMNIPDQQDRAYAYRVQDFAFSENMKRYSLRTLYYPKENSKLDQVLNQIIQTLKFTQ